MPRPGVADPHAALLEAIRAPIDGPPLRDLVRPGQRVAISVCDVTRAQPRREQILALFEEMPGIARGDVTILIATGTHRSTRRRARTDARPRPPRPTAASSTTTPATRACWMSVGYDLDRRPRLPQSRVARGRRAHHDRLRRAALLRRLQRRAEDGRARTGRPRDGDDAARRGAHRPSRTPSGASPRATRSTTTCARSRGWCRLHFSLDVTLNREQKITARVRRRHVRRAPRRLRLCQGHGDARRARRRSTSC